MRLTCDKNGKGGLGEVVWLKDLWLQLSFMPPVSPPFLRLDYWTLTYKIL